LRLGDEPRDTSPEQVIDGSLVLLRQMMDMDVALLTEIADDREVIRHCAGEWPGAGDLSGVAVPLQDTFCNRLLAGEIDNIVPDVAAEPAVRDLPPTPAGGPVLYRRSDPRVPLAPLRAVLPGPGGPPGAGATGRAGARGVRALAARPAGAASARRVVDRLISS